MDRPKRPFSTYKRPTTKKKISIFYIKFRDTQTGSYLTPVSSGQHSRSGAEVWAWNYLKEHPILIASRDQTLEEYSRDYWDFERSPYIQDRLARGFTYSRTFAVNCSRNMKLHVLPHLGKLKVAKITKAHVRSWLLALYRGEYEESRKISASTINKILSVLKITLDGAKDAGIIQENPAAGIGQLREQPRSRGVPTVEEIRKLFAVNALKPVWGGDLRCMIMNALACVTGMRQGEIRGLRLKNVFEDHIDVVEAWEDNGGPQGTGGLKLPKTGQKRSVPIPSNISKMIQDLIGRNRWKEPDDFLFYGDLRGKPLDKKQIQKRINAAYKAIGIPQAERLRRHICFHSYRHFWNSRMINERIPIQKVRAITGHATEVMTQNYYHPDKFSDVVAIQESLFSTRKEK